ncbi:MAG: alfa-L-rhamnosidase [Leifsonia xyli]|nr:MAG: alfa-L-rhamnosidase [Leifsonia xyli]
MQATELRTDYLVEPIGLGTTEPRLFWTCAGGLAQTAYRIVAHRAGELVWDTGRVDSPRMTGIPWEGAALGSRDRIEWSVQLWDEDGAPGTPVASSFELGLLAAADWSASWITGDYRPVTRERYPVDCFRTEFASGDAAGAEVASARLYITACGLYEASMNGERVGDAVMAPGFTSYGERLHYQAYDVTELVRRGTNTLEVQLADGWFRGAIGAMGRRNVYGRETKLLAQLELRLVDGTTRTIGSGGDWHWSNDGALRFADMKDGETVDLRMRPGYGGRAKATSYPVVPSASGNVVAREQERFTPEVTRTPAGAQLFDFGQNIAGYVELEWEARAGQQLVLRFGEVVGENGELDLSPIQVRAGKENASPLQRIELHSADGMNRYRTRFAVFGFQYAELVSELELAPEQLTAIAVYSDMRTTGAWESSHPLVDRFVENTRWSMKGNFLEVPTDCPTRERAPWTGDVQIFTRTGTFLMDTSAFLGKWLVDLRDRQGADGKVPCHAPDVRNNEYLPGYDAIKRMDGAAGWADAAVLVPLRLYELYRDEQLLRDSYASMKAHVVFQIGRTGRTGFMGKRVSGPDHRYISNVGQAFGEWLEPKDVYQPKFMDFVAPHPEEATAYLAHACAIMVQVATLLGHDEDVALFEEYRDGCTRAYVNQFTPVDSTRQSKLVRPLALGLLEGELAESTLAQLVAAIEERDYRVGTGFLSTPLILPLLSRMGRSDVAYRMLENESSPGWLHEVLAGATTVWEDWEGDSSRNHYSPGSVCQWLFETVAGVDVVGERAFRLAPVPGGTLEHASFRYASVFGEVASSWRRDGGTVHYRFEVPANTTAEIALPGGTTASVGAGVWEYAEAA